VARYWSISAVPESAHPSPLVITTKLAAAILVVAVVRRRGSAGPVLPLWCQPCSWIDLDVTPQWTAGDQVTAIKRLVVLFFLAVKWFIT